MEAAAQSRSPGGGEELHLLPVWQTGQERERAVRAGVLSLLLHALAIATLAWAPLGGGVPRHGPNILADLRKFTPLIAPPAEMTQKEPNRGKISREFDLESLLPRPSLRLPPSMPSTTRPASPVPAGTPVPAPAIPEPPKIETAQARPGLEPAPALGTAPAAPPPPQIQAQERPKLAFETPGTPSGSARSPVAAQPRLTPPGSSVSEAVRELARGGVSGGLIVGDIGEGVGGLGPGLNLPPAPGRSGSTLELLSDPMGVDFRPYLIRILSTVRRNWFAVIPESARLGRRGRVAIQFAINRDGSVPKLVIASPSGAEALDRAAVAGISASNPFPPLPSEFRGPQVRLQFTFLYNMVQ